MRPQRRQAGPFKILFMFLGFFFFVCVSCGVFAVIFSPDDETRASRESTRQAVAQKLQTDDFQATKASEPTLTVSPTATVAPTATPTATPVPNLVVGQNTYLRGGPGTFYRGVQLVNQGDSLPVYGRDEAGAWLLVDEENQLWINSAVATLESVVETVPVIPTSTPTATSTTPPTRTPLPTATPRPSATPVPVVSIRSIYGKYENMTELQFKEYKKTIIGKPVRETVEIANVSDDGKIGLSGEWSPFLFNVWDFCVVVTGAPKDVALSLNGGERVYLEAIINGIVSDYSYYNNCDTALILTYEKIGP